MSVGDVLEEAFVWVGRAVRVMPAFKALWQAVEEKDADKQFAAQVEMTRAIRTEQARTEIGGP